MPPSTILTPGFAEAPLNELLGTPANIRLLRLLADQVAGAVSAPDAAELTGLTEAGARRALNRMARTGFVERLGGGRGQQFRLRENEPLLEQLRVLFRAERSRYEELLSRLRTGLGVFTEITTAWIDEHPQESGQPLHLGVLAPSDDLAYLQEELRRRIVELEGHFDLTIEIHYFSRAEMPAVDWGSAIILAGWPTEADAPRQHTGPLHGSKDDRARKASRIVADLVERDASLIQRARRHADYLLKEDQGAAVHEIREWQQILQYYSRERVRDFLVSDTPRAQRLRQSSPFFAVLTAGEREEVWTGVELDDA